MNWIPADEKVIFITDELGFGSLRTFNKVFLEIMGCSPSEYRKQTVEPSVNSR